MAYVNIEIDGLTSGIAPISAFTNPPSGDLGTSVPSGYTFNTSAVVRLNNVQVNTIPFWIFGNESYGIQWAGSATSWQYLRFYINNQSIGDITLGLGDGDEKDNLVSIMLGIDEDTQKGSIFAIQQYRYYSTHYYGRQNATTGFPFKNTDLAYNWIKNGIVIPYNWQSVPSISGKNGILLPLSTLNDVNDGDPITTSDTSKIIIVPQSNVKQLVLNRIQQS